ncbi:hypothetical protein FR483_n172L [Paramecium bursaria Chlorella virus FR483]|uniref:Uncharacterized protein n172L n=1 Tax=Paramecium bursaria Chlorella virus FR483 TaxID=399781 RepID=A7J6M6_PBCVF|nr:hypothetical protein FR483_n172L [Paramecium bursaria Chlorella virus FR483]ABT15457.1 hypothetical protein FR483_n172L [Paramecium bursaria Chlorella virus FR483]
MFFCSYEDICALIYHRAHICLQNSVHFRNHTRPCPDRWATEYHRSTIYANGLHWYVYYYFFDHIVLTSCMMLKGTYGRLGLHSKKV